MNQADRVAVDAVTNGALPLTGTGKDYDLLLEFIGDARFVLLGEASHGTHEFYESRAEITQRLIEEKGFTAVAVEADWPDAYRVNRYVRGWGDDTQALDALNNFRRFPLWMWRNAEVLDFIGWLKECNRQLPEQQRSGFYGLDLYSLHASVDSMPCCTSTRPAPWSHSIPPRSGKGAKNCRRPIPMGCEVATQGGSDERDSTA